MIPESQVAHHWLSLAHASADTLKTRPLAGTWIVKLGRSLVAVACDGYRAHFDWNSAKPLTRDANSERFKAGLYAHAPAYIRSAMRDEQDRWPARFASLLERLEHEPLFDVDANALWQAVGQLEEECSGGKPVAVRLDVTPKHGTLRLAAVDARIAFRAVEILVHRPKAELHGTFPSSYLIDALAPYGRGDAVALTLGRADGTRQRVLGLGKRGVTFAVLTQVPTETVAPEAKG